MLCNIAYSWKLLPTIWTIGRRYIYLVRSDVFWVYHYYQFSSIIFRWLLLMSLYPGQLNRKLIFPGNCWSHFILFKKYSIERSIPDKLLLKWQVYIHLPQFTIDQITSGWHAQCNLNWPQIWMDVQFLCHVEITSDKAWLILARFPPQLLLEKRNVAFSTSRSHPENGNHPQHNLVIISGFGAINWAVHPRGKIHWFKNIFKDVWYSKAQKC